MIKQLINFGKGMFDVCDVWVTPTSKKVHVCPDGSQDEGQIYLSFKLTKEQKAVLGNTACNYIRIAVKKVD